MCASPLERTGIMPLKSKLYYNEKTNHLTVFGKSHNQDLNGRRTFLKTAATAVAGALITKGHRDPNKILTSYL